MGECLKFHILIRFMLFDWHGRLVQKVETDYDIDKMLFGYGEKQAVRNKTES